MQGELKEGRGPTGWSVLANRREFVLCRFGEWVYTQPDLEITSESDTALMGYEAIVIGDLLMVLIMDDEGDHYLEPNRCHCTGSCR